MRNRNRAVALFLAVLTVVPVFAAGRPACCAPKAPVASHACCRPGAGMSASLPKPCCKTPPAPRPEARDKDAAPAVLSLALLEAGAPATPSIALPGPVTVRLARRAHHAEAPDDSPPDRLALTQILLI